MKLEEIFLKKKPIIGMIHLAGRTRDEKLKIALDELAKYEQEGIDGAIVEDYHGEPMDVLEVLKKSQNRFNKLVIGVNLLQSPYSSFRLASEYGAKFVQFDSVQTPDLDLELYSLMRNMFPNIMVLGGVGFKYIAPTGNPLEVDLMEGKSRCEAIVTTGDGTGMETPLSKLQQYKKLLGDFPLFVGAGVNSSNAYAQLSVVDGAIIGSYFKYDENTKMPINLEKIRVIMKIVQGIRKEEKNV